MALPCDAAAAPMARARGRRAWTDRRRRKSLCPPPASGRSNAVDLTDLLPRGCDQERTLAWRTRDIVAFGSLRAAIDHWFRRSQPETKPVRGADFVRPPPLPRRER